MGWLKSLLQLLSALSDWWRDRQLIEAGKAEQRAADLAKTSEVKDEQLRAEQDRPVDRDDLARRLRDPADGL